MGYWSTISLKMLIVKTVVDPLISISVQGLHYSERILSIWWLLIPRLLESPGHQHPQYWLCEMDMLLSPSRLKLNTRQCFNDKESKKEKGTFMLPKKKEKEPKQLSM